MPLPAGDVVIDFTKIATINPYINTSFTKIDTGNVQITANALKPSGFNGLCRFVYNGSMNVSTASVNARVEIKNAGTSDDIYAGVLFQNGAGYVLQISANSLSIATVNTGGTTGGLNSGSINVAISNGDIVELGFVPGTHVLTALYNNNVVFGVSDSTYTYTSGMGFAFGFDPENSNLSTLDGFGGFGIAGATVTSKPFKLYANGAIQANVFTANVALPPGVVLRLGANNVLQANGLITLSGAGKIKIQSNGQLVCNNTIVV
jgi:hypothetical protein